jgi:hypothetical protein
VTDDELGFLVCDFIHLGIILKLISNCRMELARLAKPSIRTMKGKSETDILDALDKIPSSTIGRALATWKQPIEVIRVEMQSAKKDNTVTVKPTVLTR